MKCPECEGKTKVVDSGEYIGLRIRRRNCLICKHSFYTVEEETDDVETIRSWMAHKKAIQREGKHELRRK